VFSPSAAAYGLPDVEPVREDGPAQPINPYGETELVGEWLARAAAKAWGLRVANLRHFNVAGAGWDELGDPAIFNLVPRVFDRLERGEAPRVFGDGYPTPDGTCIATTSTSSTSTTRISRRWTTWGTTSDRTTHST